jgi:hypothetical protein
MQSTTTRKGEAVSIVVGNLALVQSQVPHSTLLTPPPFPSGEMLTGAIGLLSQYVNSRPKSERRSQQT